jgi:hypothetical protein
MNWKSRFVEAVSEAMPQEQHLAEIANTSSASRNRSYQ